MVTLRKIVALLALSLVSVAASAGESSGQSQTLTAFYTAPVVSMAPMWIAKEAGLFKKQGLDVKLVFIASGPIGTAAVLSGEADVGIIGGFAPLRAMVGGAKGLVIIGQSKNLITSKIVAKQEIVTVQDLKGSDWASTALVPIRICSRKRRFPVFRSIPSKIFNTFSSAMSARSLPVSRPR